MQVNQAAAVAHEHKDLYDKKKHVQVDGFLTLRGLLTQESLKKRLKAINNKAGTAVVYQSRSSVLCHN